MKICIVNNKYPEINTKILANNLYKLGHEVTIVANNIECFNIIENGIKIINIIDNKNMLSDTLRDMQKNGDIDIIHTYSDNLNINCFLRYRKVPLIVTLKENNINKKLLSKADKIISPSMYLKEMYNYDIQVIPSLHDESTFKFKNKREKNKNIVYVGELNENSKVLELASYIDKIIEELGNVKFQFIGNDTNSNKLKISTKEYIYNLVKKENYKYLEFIDYMDESGLNEIYNNANLLFNPDIEVLANSNICGVPYLGSKKVMELNSNYDYYFNKSNIYEKIIELFINKEMQKLITINLTDCVLKNECIINKIIKAYRESIDIYNKNIITTLFDNHINKKIIDFKKIESGQTNFVYIVNTKNKKYVVKTYKKDINVDVIKDLITISKKNHINLLNPIHNKFYKINNNIICIYEFIEGKHIKRLNNEQTSKLLDFIKLDKPSNKKCNNLLDKVDFYYDKLREMDTKKIHRIYIDELLKKYMKLKNYSIFNEKQLVHGDLGPSNILWNESGNFTIIDLDETIEFTKLYDLIVLAINYSKNGSEIDEKVAKKILKSIDMYSKIDIINVWNFYLLKVILEKIYLYEINKIDLRDEFEMKDNWEDYYQILNSSIIEDILNK